MRQTLETEKQHQRLPGKRIVTKPAAAALLELLRSFHVILIDTGKGTLWVLSSNTNLKILELLQLAGFSEETYVAIPVCYG